MTWDMRTVSSPLEERKTRCICVPEYLQTTSSYALKCSKMLPLCFPYAAFLWSSDTSSSYDALQDIEKHCSLCEQHSRPDLVEIVWTPSRQCTLVEALGEMESQRTPPEIELLKTMRTPSPMRTDDNHKGEVHI